MDGSSRYVHMLKKKKSFFRIILLSLGIFVIAIAGFGFWYWTNYKNEIIKNKLEKAIAARNKGVYKVTYDSLELDEKAGWLHVYNMQLAYDSNLYKTQIQNDEIPSLLFSITIPEIKISAVKTPPARLDDEIIAGKLEILNPVVQINYTGRGKDSTKNVPAKKVYEQVLGDLDLVQVDTIIIQNGQLLTISEKTGKPIVSVKDIFMTLTDVKVDSAAHEESNRYLFAKQLKLEAGKINWTSDDRLYHYQATNLKAGTAAKSLDIGSFTITPLLNENAFVNAIPTQDDRFDFSFRAIHFTGVDINKLGNGYLQADTMVVNHSSFKIYRDLARPRDKKNRTGHYPHQVMDDAPFRFNIKKVIMPGSFVEYKERNHITRQSGKVQFRNIHAMISNFTNDKEVVKAGETMTASVHSRFLGRTSFYTQWTFYLFHPKGRFDVAGTMSDLDATLLNPLTEPMGPARIKKGQLNSIGFRLQGDDYNMTGQVRVLYEDLKIALLEKDKGTTETDKKFLTSFLANVVIKNDNPRANDEVREVNVSLARDRNRSLFWLCWKTLFKGIRETVGIRR
jgi:hypothetical protein